MTPTEHTAKYDPSMTGRKKAYFCRRCCAYVTRDHAELAQDQASPSPAHRERA